MGKEIKIIILLIVVIIGILYPLFVDNIENTGNKTEDSFVEATYDFFDVTFRFFLGIPIFVIGMMVILLIPTESKHPTNSQPPLYQPIPLSTVQYY